jgi:hypothetical protein
MAEQSAQQEPSMEEILASIRRIISEDGEEEAAGEQADAPAGPTAVEDVPAGEPEEEPADAMEAATEPEEEPVEDPAPVPEPAEASAGEAQAPFEEPEPDSAAPAEANVATAEDVADVFDTVEAAPAMQEDDGEDVLELTDVVPDPAQGDPIVSHMTEAATSEHLRALSGLMVRSYPGSENTLEGLVREMLKPMLREWLDANLPSLVEQLVNREIARIAGREK